MSELPSTLVLSRLGSSARLAAFVELTKPRIALLVLVTTAIGFLLGHGSSLSASDGVRLLATLLGTALVASGASALNQLIEADADARMSRTRGRPLPSGRLNRGEVLAFGLVVAALGALLLLAVVNALAAAVAAGTFVGYVGAYTPLKRVTPACVLVGAVPGALPPVIGWAGGAGDLTFAALAPFLVLFFWQMPHFAAISWLYRDEYSAAGYPMLPVVDVDGTRTNLHIATHLTALMFASMLPLWWRLNGMAYAAGALLCGLAFIASCVAFIARRSKSTARLVVLVSIVYLPVLFALLLIDRR